MTTDRQDQRTKKDYEQDLESVRVALSGPEPAEPPHLLDQAVLNTARRELEKPSAAWTRRIRLRWLGALSTAAIVVLALTVVVQQEQPVPRPAPPAADGLRLEQDVRDGQSNEKRSDELSAKARAVPPVVRDEAQPAKMTAEFLQEEMALPDAENWIQRLLQLKEKGQETVLAEELAAFRKAYPEYPLPPELEH